MTYDDYLLLACRGLIGEYVDDLCGILIKTLICQLQSIKQGSNMTLSGEDSGLNNLWDEICVQVQGEQSIFFDSYVSYLFDIIEITLMQDTKEYERKMIWLMSVGMAMVIMALGTGMFSNNSFLFALCCILYFPKKIYLLKPGKADVKLYHLNAQKCY